MPVKKIVSSLLAFCFAFTSSLSYAETATVTLKKGKNYIAVPAMTKAWTTADVAKGVGAGFVESWLYDGNGSAPAYTHYRVGQELMADFLSVPASGGVCVIVVNADSTLTLPNVVPEALREFSAPKGWQLIGWTYKNTPPVADALRPLAPGTDYDEVRWFDPGTQTWKSSAEVDATGFATVQPYQAYAVHLLSSSNVALGAISINSAATYTKSASVSVTLRAPSGYTQYALSNTMTMPTTGTALSLPVSWTLSAGEGAKTVYAQFFKADGTASGVYSASIILDTTAPTILSAKSKGKSKVRVVFSEALAATPTASNFTITPALTVSGITKESDTSYVLALSTPSNTTSTYTLTASGITDAAGNAVASGSVTFDRKPIETIYFYHGSTRIAKKENGVTTYLLQDHLGSTVATADSTGKLLSRTTYTPFGSVATESGDTDSHKFTGKELDPSTGLYDYEARQYDAGLGRFISADPLVFSAVGVKSTRYKTLQNFLSYPQNLNRYSYCLNNPVKYVDPDGKSVVGIGTILALILGVVCLGAFMAPAVISSQIGQNQVINSQIEYASRIDNGQDTASATNGQSLGKQGIYASEAMAIVVYKGIKDGSSKIQGKIFGFRAPSNVMKSLAMPLKVQGVFDQTNSFLESRLDEALDNFKKEHQENNQKQKQFKQDKKEKSQ